MDKQALRRMVAEQYAASKIGVDTYLRLGLSSEDYVMDLADFCAAGYSVDEYAIIVDEARRLVEDDVRQLQAITA